MKFNKFLVTCLWFNLVINAQVMVAQTMKFKEGKQSVSFQSDDGLTIQGDLYMTANAGAPFILLFHQAGYSRGEYLETAPKLNHLGFNCLAIDQRSGNEVNGIVNSTFAEARKKSLGTEYIDAFPDLEAALNFVIKTIHPQKLLILGSSYSASLCFILARKYPNNIDGVLAFSPGEYLTYEGKSIQDFAKEVKCPVFITSARSETNHWSAIYSALPSNEKQGYIPTVAGVHGSKTLWKSNAGNEVYWSEVEKFLNCFKE